MTMQSFGSPRCGTNGQCPFQEICAAALANIAKVRIGPPVTQVRAQLVCHFQKASPEALGC